MLPSQPPRGPARPPWLKVPLPGGGKYYAVRRTLARQGVSTVCVEARCPNTGECWGCGTATFILLGQRCTRSCRFCAVGAGQAGEPPDPREPGRVAEAAAALGLRYAVLTSVTRDDLPDGGAAHFARTVAALRGRIPQVIVELLTPDFGADPAALAAVAASGAQVLAHNLETTPGLTPAVRDRRCSADRSLQVLRAYRALAPERVVKSSLLLGLGEADPEVLQTLRRLREAGVDWVTLGQYLRPTRAHLPVARYVPPARFADLAGEARQLGFALVDAGPLVRSSYRAGEQQVAALLARRAGQAR